MKRQSAYITILVLALLAVLPLFSTAEAALGDFLFKWGAEYNFRYPRGIAVDAGGNVYVADSLNHRIQVFDSNGTFIRKWGSRGSGDGKLSYPYGVTVDGPGNVYVADGGNHRIQVFDGNGTFIRKWGSYGAGDGQFYYPRGIAVDGSGNVYVAAAFNHRIQVFDNNGTFLRKWGSLGSGDGQFFRSWGIAVDGLGNVYVADTWNNRIQVFDSNGTFIRKWGSRGSGDGQFFQPVGIAVDGSGNVYVTGFWDNRIQVFDSNGTFLRKWGSYGPGDGQFYHPTGIAVDGPGNVYVADTYNHRIQVFEGLGPADSTPPVITAAIEPLANAAGWHRTDVTVSFTCSDAESGIASCTAPVTVVTEGAGQGVNGTAVDNAGNSASVSVTLNIDRTSPVVAVTGVAEGEKYPACTPPAPGFTATDALSGVASQGSVLDGGNANGVGTFTYAATAADKAGNTATETVAYKVVYSYGGFQTPVTLNRPFKLGSTIPFKFALTDGCGAYVPNAAATLSLVQVSGAEPAGDPIDGTTNVPDSGNVFRYDPVENQYVYNLSTGALSVGSWQASITIEDGEVYTTAIGIK